MRYVHRRSSPRYACASPRGCASPPRPRRQNSWTSPHYARAPPEGRAGTPRPRCQNAIGRARARGSWHCVRVCLGGGAHARRALAAGIRRAVTAPSLPESAALS
eukprot:639234-Alexandrium_andersonii.AAC.1